tara:strand:- start:208 stop:384 length:177 start_codon:yes stop_codon:yes gene_type:complete
VSAKSLSSVKPRHPIDLFRVSSSPFSSSPPFVPRAGYYFVIHRLFQEQIPFSLREIQT